PAAFPAHVDPVIYCPFWDWDVFVLARDLERLGPDGREKAIAYMPVLLGHPEERVRALAIDTLSSCGTVTHLAAAVAELGEPRNGTVSSVARLFSLIDGDRIEEAAQLILQMPAPSAAQLAWARSHVEEDHKVSTGHPDEKVLPPALQDDPHPHVRAAAMTQE